MDLRVRILAAYDEGHTSEAVAEMFRVSPKTVRRYLKRRDETGTVKEMPHGGGAHKALTPDDREVLRQLYEEQSDAYLREIAKRLEEVRGVRVSIHTVARELKKMGITRKKNTSKQPSKAIPRFKLQGKAS